jgi:EmrB/QacA subfamily drug resistance transporter
MPALHYSPTSGLRRFGRHHARPQPEPTSRMSATPPVLDGRGQWLTLSAVVFAVFMTTLDNTVVNVALPSIQADLHLGLSSLAWVVNAYVLSFAVLLLTGGRLADSFGRRRAFLAGLGGFTAASLLAGLAPSAGVLIAARVLQGASAALMTPPTLAIISHAFPDEKQRGTAIGLWAGAAALAAALGPVIGGLLAQHIDWSWIFYVNVPVGIAGICVGARYISESRDPEAGRRLDLPGLGLSTGALFSLTYALIKANDLGWTSPTIVALLAVAAAGLLAFIWAERHAPAPMLDLAVFRNATFTGANLVNLIVTLGTFGVFLYTSLFFQDVLGYSPTKAGTALLPWIGTYLIVAPLTGKLAERLPARWVTTAGLATMAAGLFLLSGLDEHSTLTDLLPGLLLGGLGGALTVPLANVAISTVPVEKAGVASGVFNTFRETGGSLGIAIIGAVFLAAQHDASANGATPAHAFASGYSHGLAIAALLAVLGAAIGALTIGRRRPNGAQTSPTRHQAPSRAPFPTLSDRSAAPGSSEPGRRATRADRSGGRPGREVVRRCHTGTEASCRPARRPSGPAGCSTPPRAALLRGPRRGTDGARRPREPSRSRRLGGRVNGEDVDEPGTRLGPAARQQDP